MLRQVSARTALGFKQLAVLRAVDGPLDSCDPRHLP
jgi:hypothetical protein